MITSVRAYLQGGLGNQCFIYATTRALAARVGGKVVLDCDYLAEDHVYKRKLSLDQFGCAFESAKLGCKLVRVLKGLRYKALRDWAGFKPRRDAEVERLNVEVQRRRAEEKVAEWLAGVDEKSFDSALEKLVEEKCAAGEYVFERHEDIEKSIVAAKHFFNGYSRRIVVLSDGRCVYFAPDPRSKARNAGNSECWAEYAFHAVSSGGDRIPGKNYTFRKYNEYKVINTDLIVPTLKSERCVPVLKAKPVQDAVKFFGAAHLGGLFDVVVRLDECGNVNANMTEVTFEASSKRGQKKPPQLVSLAEAVRTVVSHQTATGTNPPDKNSIANRIEARKGAASARSPFLYGKNYIWDVRPYKYRALPTEWRGALTLDGYWQSEKYFYDAREQLLKDFQLKDNAWIEHDPVAQQIKARENSVFMHVRSYKEVPGKSDGQCAKAMEDYYRKAIACVRERVEDPTFFVFSDDIDLAREIIGRVEMERCGKEFFYVEPFRPATATSNYNCPSGQIRDFTLMRMCKHGIVADSSFSWWAGWLGEQERLLKGESPIRIHVDRRVMNDDFWPERWVAIS